MTRTIRTAAELDALPVGSVVRGTAFEYGPAATIYVRQEEFWYAGWGVDEEAAVRTAAHRAEAFLLQRWFEALR